MPVVGLDDTDSRERGMCTTYVAARIDDRLRDAGYGVQRQLLVRCNPAVEHKTRGNAALALHVEAPSDCSDDATVRSDAPDRSTAGMDAPEWFAIARETIDDLAATADDDANPGVVGAACDPAEVPGNVAAFAETAVRGHHALGDAVTLAEEHGFDHAGWGSGRGRIGALAAVGAWASDFDDWTYERIAYREQPRWGTERDVDAGSVFDAATGSRPAVWDTVDRGTGTAVCVPRTPCPVLFGIRGDDSAAVEEVATAIESEPVDRVATFVTNQGTDAHLREGAIGALEDAHAYRVDGVIATVPETKRGGHVFLEVDAVGTAGGSAERSPSDRLRCVAFEPTKQFRDRVRSLRPGDAVTVCGEVSDGTLKLEKFAVRDLRRTEETTPVCPDCERTMKSAGADQGYRCRDCGTDAPGPAERRIDRELEEGWYEVPPVARRHVAKPLVRGGFDAAVHPES